MRAPILPAAEILEVTTQRQAFNLERDNHVGAATELESRAAYCTL
jgi:hypothetical protein